MTSIEPHTAGANGTATALLAVLRERLDRPALTYATPPQTLRGGFWAEIFTIRLDGAPPELSGDLVVRIMPNDLVGRRETVVQREVAAQGFSAPTVRLAGGADDGLGRAFMVMDRVDGSPLLADLSAGRALASLPRLSRRLPAMLARTSFDLHQLDPQPVIDALEREVPDAWIDVDGLLRRLAGAADEVESATMTEAVGWLAANQRPIARPAVCHGDLHPFNVLVDGDGTTLVDWSNATIADPEFDLAFTMITVRNAPIDLPDALGPVTRWGTNWLARKVLSDYRRLATPLGIHIDDDRLRWYSALMCTRMLTEPAQWRARGELDDHRDHPFVHIEGALVAELRGIIR
jgi:aminoglycoside phosphotransferase (APT) family kinase protein